MKQKPINKLYTQLESMNLCLWTNIKDPKERREAYNKVALNHFNSYLETQKWATYTEDELTKA